MGGADNATRPSIDLTLQIEVLARKRHPIAVADIVRVRAWVSKPSSVISTCVVWTAFLSRIRRSAKISRKTNIATTGLFSASDTLGSKGMVLSGSYFID